MSRDFRHVLACVYNTPLAILPAKLVEIEAVLWARIRTGKGVSFVFGDHDDIEPKASTSPNEELFQRHGDVAVIPLYGTISQRPSIMSKYSGGTSSEMIGKAVEAAGADRSVRAIVMDIDSPGGTVAGLEPAAAKIAAVSMKKKCVAVANSMCASGAYWFASQCSEIVACPAATLGSVGVIAAHVDESRANDMEGVKVTLIHAGQYKAELNSTQPLSTGARDHIQEQVDDLYDRFVRAIATGRKTSIKNVKENFGQGRMYLDSEAVRRGMADRVSTLEDVLSELLSNGPKGRSAAESQKLKRETAAKFAEMGLTI